MRTTLLLLLAVLVLAAPLATAAETNDTSPLGDANASLPEGVSESGLAGKVLQFSQQVMTWLQDASSWLQERVGDFGGNATAAS